MGFGDLSIQVPQKASGTTGGLRVEAGCWTGAEATVYLPTTFSFVNAIIICGTAPYCQTIPCVTNGYIKVGTETNPSGLLFNYIAAGW